MAKTFVDIVGRDLTGGAFDKVQGKVSALGGGVSGLAKSFAGLGLAVGTSFLVNGIKNIVNAQDEMAKLSKSTGIAVETLAGLEFAATQSGTSMDRAAKGVRKFSEVVASSITGTEKSSKVIAALGLNLEDLKSQNPEQQFLSLAGALEKLGREDQAVAVTALMGDRMSELVPLLSNGEAGLRGLIEAGQELNPITAESAAQAELFNDNLDKLGRSAGVVGIEIANQMLPALADVSTRISDSVQKNGLFITSLNELQNLIKGGLLLQLNALKDAFNFIFGIENEIPEQVKKVSSGLSDAGQEVTSLTKDVEAATPKVSTFAETLQKINDEFAKKGSGSGGKTKIVSESENFIKSIEKQAAELGKTGTELQRYRAEQLGVSDALDESFSKIERYNEELAKQKGFAQEQAEVYRRVEQITGEVATKQEIFNQKLEELNRLKPHLSIETYNRALKQAQKELQETADDADDSFNEMNQYAIQASRNMQDAFADFLFDPMQNGFDGLLDSFETMLKKMIAQMAASGIASGIQSLFSGGTFSGGFSSAFGGGSGGSSLFGNGLSSLSSVFGGGSAAATAGTTFTAGAGGAGTAFIGGSGTALGGSGVGAGAAAGGSSASLAATGWGALAVATMIGNKLLATNNEIGGMTAKEMNKLSTTFKSPLGFAGTVSSIGTGRVVGDLIGGKLGKTINKFIPDLMAPFTKLFGREPYKFRQQFFGGIATDTGLEQGNVTDVFRSKGGLLRGNKHKQQDPENELEIIGIVDTALRGFGQSIRSFSESLAIDAGKLDGFHEELKVISEKNEAITPEALTAEIERLGDAMALKALPAVKDLNREGESYIDTLGRLAGEFSALQGVLLIAGNSFEESKKTIADLGFDTREAILSMAGGIETLQAQTDFFYNNVLTDADRLRLKSEQLSAATKQYGVSADITVEQLRSAFVSGNLSVEMRLAALRTASLIVEVNQLRDAVDGAGNAVGNLSDASLKAKRTAGVESAFSRLQESIDAKRNKLTEDYQNSVNRVQESIGKLQTLSSALKSGIETINPISLSRARETFKIAIAEASRGNVVDLSKIQGALGKLTESDSSSFGNRFDFLTSQAKNSDLLSQLGDAADFQVSVEERTLAELQKGYDRQIGHLDRMSSLAQTEVDLLTGIESGVLELKDALGRFNTATSAADAGGFVGLGGTANPNSPFSGNRGISGNQITDFVNNNPNPFDIYNAAIANGVSSSQLAANSNFTEQQIAQFVRDNNLASFNGGGIVPRTGLALIHKDEKITTPAQQGETNNLLRTLVSMMSEAGVYTKKTADTLERVTRDGDSLITSAA